MHSGDLMHRAWIAIAVGVACLLIGGCTSEAADPSGTPTAPSSSTPSSASPSPSPTATSEPSPSAPVMPALARKKTPAGAKAFVRYYVEVLNSAWISGRTPQLRGLATTHCLGCRLAAREIEKSTAKGGYRRGSRWTVIALYAIPMQPLDQPIMNVAIRNSSGTYRPSRGADVRKIDAGVTGYDFHLRWVPNRWLVTKWVGA